MCEILNIIFSNSENYVYFCEYRKSVQNLGSDSLERPVKKYNCYVKTSAMRTYLHPSWSWNS